MMKRVCNTRFAKSAMLLAVFLLVSGAGAPVWARENMSAGQAGDPTDGNGISSTGSGSQDTGDESHAASQVRSAPTIVIPDLVILVNGVAYRIDIQLLFSRWKAR